MKLPSFTTLSALLLASEIALAVAKRSKSRASGKDRLTLPAPLDRDRRSVSSPAFIFALPLPQGRLPHPQTFYVFGLILFLLGLIIRWVAIIHLGRFFTVNVAIAEDHQLITTGPYRLRAPPLLHRHAPHFPRLRPLHAEHLFSRSSRPPDHRRFPLANARGRNRAARSLRRTVSAVHHKDVQPAAMDLLSWTPRLADEDTRTVLRIKCDGAIYHLMQGMSLIPAKPEVIKTQRKLPPITR